ncbi:MAG: hypothetical protein AAF432_15220, partial [Planctomycetota bacterium]
MDRAVFTHTATSAALAVTLLTGLSHAERPGSAKRGAHAIDAGAIVDGVGPMLVVPEGFESHVTPALLDGLQDGRMYVLGPNGARLRTGKNGMTMRHAGRTVWNNNVELQIEPEEPMAGGGAAAAPAIISITLTANNNGTAPSNYGLILPRPVNAPIEPPATLRGLMMMSV